MNEDKRAQVEAAVDDVLKFAEEVETAGQAATGGAELDRVRALLRAWVDRVEGVVVNNALGQVTLIHENGVRSSITSKELHFALSAPVRDWKGQ